MSTFLASTSFTGFRDQCELLGKSQPTDKRNCQHLLPSFTGFQVRWFGSGIVRRSGHRVLVLEINSRGAWTRVYLVLPGFESNDGRWLRLDIAPRCRDRLECFLNRPTQLWKRPPHSDGRGPITLRGKRSAGKCARPRSNQKRRDPIRSSSVPKTCIDATKGNMFSTIFTRDGR